MSIRTIIEVNHDRVHDLEGRDSYLWSRLLLNLRGGGFTEDERQFFADHGIRILRQRHHSDHITLEVE